MKYPLLFPLAFFAGLGTVACSGEEPAAPVAEESTAQAPPPVAEEPEGPSFDITEVPVSDAPLGEFPYFSPPPGYHTTDKLSSTVARDVFPFWVGDHYIGVEGRIHQANIRAVEGKVFSAIELAAEIDSLITSAGGVKLADMEIPRARSSEVLTRELTTEYSFGLCWPSEPVRTYVVHRTDKDIWIHTCTYGDIGGAWIIAETDTVEPAASVLPSEQLQQKLDADGKVAVQINFASDSADILPGSLPQLAQIGALLDGNADLRLSVNGHTDDTGTADRNLALSKLRAEAVVAELRALGADGARLEARGLGRMQPVGDNATAEGRAANRRVELVAL